MVGGGEKAGRKRERKAAKNTKNVFSRFCSIVFFDNDLLW